MGMIYLDFKNSHEVINSEFLHYFHKLNAKNKKIKNIEFSQESGNIKCETISEDICDIVLPDGYEVIGYDPSHTIISDKSRREPINARLSYSYVNGLKSRLFVQTYPYEHIFTEKEYLLENVCLNTERELGSEFVNQVEEGLRNIFQNNDYSYLTNTDNLRDELQEKMKSIELIKIMYSTLIKKGIKPEIGERSYGIAIIEEYCSYIRNILMEENSKNENKDRIKLVYENSSSNFPV